WPEVGPLCRGAVDLCAVGGHDRESCQLSVATRTFVATQGLAVIPARRLLSHSDGGSSTARSRYAGKRGPLRPACVAATFLTIKQSNIRDLPYLFVTARPERTLRNPHPVASALARTLQTRLLFSSCRV